jgi:hypothetical protein
MNVADMSNVMGVKIQFMTGRSLGSKYASPITGNGSLSDGQNIVGGTCWTIMRRRNENAESPKRDLKNYPPRGRQRRPEEKSRSTRLPTGAITMHRFIKMCVRIVNTHQSQREGNQHCVFQLPSSDGHKRGEIPKVSTGKAREVRKAQALVSNS